MTMATMTLAQQRRAKTRALALESLRRDPDPLPCEVAPILTRQRVHLDLSYELPLTCGGEQDARRLAHDDLGDLSPTDLGIERVRLQFALAFGDLSRPSWAEDWLRERLQRVQIALRGCGHDDHRR